MFSRLENVHGRIVGTALACIQNLFAIIIIFLKDKKKKKVFCFVNYNKTFFMFF